MTRESLVHDEEPGAGVLQAASRSRALRGQTSAFAFPPQWANTGIPAVAPNRSFAGSSVRAITTKAKVNLGAITYHFGSKYALYEAVLESVLTPFRERLVSAAAAGGSALTRIERFLRAAFDHTAAEPDLARLILQQLATGHPLPVVTRSTMRANIGTLAELIREGQLDGSIRSGDPRLMALSVGGQPILLALLREALSQAVALDQSDPETRTALVDSVVRFTRAGLMLGEAAA